MGVHSQINTALPESERASSSTMRRRPSDRLFLRRALTFAILFSLWLILSGQYDLFHLTLGVISCILVVLFSGDLLFQGSGVSEVVRLWFRMAAYIPWLLYQIVLANLHILYVVLHPRMMDLIDPAIIRFHSRLRSELGLVVFANSITLTPGTITVYVSVDGDFQVHAIDKPSGEPLPGEMEERIAKAMGEI